MNVHKWPFPTFSINSAGVRLAVDDVGNGSDRVSGTVGRQRYQIFFPSAHGPEGAVFRRKKPE